MKNKLLLWNLLTSAMIIIALVLECLPMATMLKIGTTLSDGTTTYETMYYSYFSIESLTKLNILPFIMFVLTCISLLLSLVNLFKTMKVLDTLMHVCNLLIVGLTFCQVLFAYMSVISWIVPIFSFLATIAIFIRQYFALDDNQ